MNRLLDLLLASAEPSVRCRARVDVLGEDPASPPVRALGEAIRTSARVETLLSERGPDGRIPWQPYAKWAGSHWVLAALADLHYPPGDPALIPLKDQVLGWLASPQYDRAVRRQKRRPYRIHASMEANAIYATLTLGLDDPRIDVLVARLLDTQWPDGGWNCDVKASGTTSSFMETTLPIRALALHAKVTGSAETKAAAQRAAEVLLCRRLYRRRSGRAIIKPQFVRLHYPVYWHYDILFGLKVMAEAGLIGDPRCADALDLLESKRLPDGGFPAEARYYQVQRPSKAGHGSLVDWGGTSKVHFNHWVALDALMVLRAAGRLR